MHAPASHILLIAFAAATGLMANAASAAGPALLDDGTVQAATTVQVEAESGFSAPFVEIGDQPESRSASGNRFISVPDGSGAQAGQPASGSDYGIGLVAGGDVALWARVWTPDAGSDAFWFRVDSGGPWTSWEPGIHAGWRWQRVAVVQLAAGPHVFSIAHQDDGVRADAFLFTSDLNLVPGNALEFTGDLGQDRHYVDVPGAFSFTGALTIEGWVNLGASPAGQWDPIIAKGGEWGLLRYKATNKLAFRSGNDDLVSLSELEPGRWYHIAATIGAGNKRLYINGVLDRSKSDVGGLAPGPAQLRFGANVHDPSGVYRGRVDEVRIWSVERSVAEINQFRDQVPPGDTTGLEGYWRFESTGSTVPDDGPNNHDAQLQGFQGNTPLRVDGLAITGPSQAVGFAGNTGSLRVDPAREGDFRFNLAFTAETWVWYDIAPTGKIPLVAKGAPWGLYLNPAGKIAFDTMGFDGGSFIADALTSERVIAPGEWHHVAATLEQVDGGILRKTIYIDGGPDASQDDTREFIGVNGSPVIFGGNGTSALAGALDEVRIWDRALSAETIAAQYSRNLNGLEPGLLLLWRMDVAEGIARNSALNGPASAGLAGSLEGGLTLENYIPGVQLGAALEPQFSLYFGGAEHVAIPHEPSLNFSPALTVEVWVRPTEQRPSTILVKGAAGYGIGLDADLRPVFFEGSDLAHSVSASSTLNVGEWFHLAVVVEQAPGGGPNGRTTFYINGVEAGSHSQGLIVNNSSPLYIGKGGTLFPQSFVGEIDEVRLWGSAATSGQIGLLAQVPLPDSGAGIPGLVGYWAFDEGTGIITTDLTPAARAGSLNGMDESNWRFGHQFGVPPIPGGLNLTTFPGAAGLWIGQVALSQVSEARTTDAGSAGPLASAGDTASFRLLLHVDDSGRVRLLKDVVVMKRRDDPNDPDSPTSIVLVTDPALIPNFEGVVRRDGKVTGLRYGSAAFDFVGSELQLLGGIGPSLGCAGNIVLAADHPTNPYRHKFHPRHQSGYTITRSIGVQFDGEPSDPLTSAPGFGVDRITGTYNETVTGLHKLPIRVQGKVELTRISKVGVLNE